MLDLKQSTVLLDRNGEHHNSESFANFLTSLSEKGINQTSFIIGGASGFPKQLTSKAKNFWQYLRWSSLIKLLGLYWLNSFTEQNVL